MSQDASVPRCENPAWAVRRAATSLTIAVFQVAESTTCFSRVNRQLESSSSASTLGWVPDRVRGSKTVAATRTTSICQSKIAPAACGGPCTWQAAAPRFICRSTVRPQYALRGCRSRINEHSSDASSCRLTVFRSRLPPCGRACLLDMLPIGAASYRHACMHTERRPHTCIGWTFRSNTVMKSPQVEEVTSLCNAAS